MLLFSITDPAFLRRFKTKVHITLPNTQELALIIEKKLENRKEANHCLKEPDFLYLAEKLNGYSPFDIDRIIGEVLTKKLGQVQGATHFKTDKFGHYYMCNENEDRAQQFTYQQVKNLGVLKLPLIHVKDLESAKKVVQQTNPCKGDEQFDDFKRQNFI